MGAEYGLLRLTIAHVAQGFAAFFLFQAIQIHVAIEDAAWKQTDPEADARKSSFEEQLNAQLAELDAKIAAESDPKKKAKLEAEKATKEQWLNAIK